MKNPQKHMPVFTDRWILHALSVEIFWRLSWQMDPRQITDAFYNIIKSDENRRGDKEMVWNNIVLYFQQFTNAGRKPFLILTEGGLWRTHGENKDLSHQSDCRSSYIGFSEATELTGSWKFKSWCTCWQRRVNAIPCEFRGLGGFEALRLKRRQVGLEF